MTTIFRYLDIYFIGDGTWHIPQYVLNSVMWSLILFVPVTGTYTFCFLLGIGGRPGSAFFLTTMALISLMGQFMFVFGKGRFLVRGHDPSDSLLILSFTGGFVLLLLTNVAHMVWTIFHCHVTALQNNDTAYCSSVFLSCQNEQEDIGLEAARGTANMVMGWFVTILVLLWDAAMTFKWLRIFRSHRRYLS